jgi:AAHS family 4-hydroxybenzoate transporter-like MFS transporter
MNTNSQQTSLSTESGGTFTASRALALLVCFLVIAIDGFNTTSISFVVPELAREWGLAPASFTVVFVATNLGAAIGFAIAGPLANRFGQRIIGVLTVALFGVTTLLTSSVSHIPELAVIRLVSAIGLGAALPVTIAAATSIIGGKHKVAASLLVTTGMSVGAVTGGVIGDPLMKFFGWPSIFLVGGVLPLVLVPAFFRVLSAVPTAGEEGGKAKANPLSALFKDGFAAYTCLLWLFSFLIFMDVYALLLWLPTLLPAFGFSSVHASIGLAAFSIGGLSGNVLMTAAVSAMTLRGRVRLKSALIIGVVLMIAGVVTLGRVPVSQVAVLLLVGVVGAGLVNGIMGQTALAVSFYPPQLRATGVGFGHAIGRVGSFVGPAIGGALLSLGWPARDIVMATVLPAVASIAVLVVLSRVVGKPARG